MASKCKKENCEKCGKKLGTQFVRVIQDRSGSMWSNWPATVDSYDEYINGLREGASDTDKIRVGLTVFDGEIDTVIKKKKLENFPTRALEAYPPRGSTSLYDAIGHSIQELDRLLDSEDTALVVIITDGGENTSSRFGREQISKMIADREKQNWTFVYIGANQDAWAVGATFGIHTGNAYTYVNDVKGRGTSMSSLSASTISHSRSGGQGTETFFADAGVDNTEQMESVTDINLTLGAEKLFKLGESPEADEDSDEE